MYSYLEKAAFAAFCGVLLIWGYVEGVFSMQVTLDLSAIAFAVQVLKAELDVLSFAAFLAVSGILYFGYRFRSSAEISSPEGPPFTAIVPVYGDADVLGRSVETLVDSTYEDIEVVIVCEADDGRTITAAEHLASVHDEVRMRINERYPGTKAGAINDALETIDDEYVGIFDADELVDPEFVASCVGKLEADDDLDVVQGRTVPEPDGLIESMAYYESVLMSFALLRIAYFLTGFRMATSRCICFRRETLEDLGGYDTEMLTEDFALTYECYKNRVTVQEMQEHPSVIDGAHTFTDWWGQRKRWMTGYTQVLHHLVADTWPFDDRASLFDHRNLISLIISFSTISGSIFLVTLLSKFAILVAVGSAFAFIAPIAIIYAITLGAHVLDYRAGTVGPPSWYFLLVPIVLPIYSLAAVKAMLEYVFTWEGEWYRVTKRA